MRRGYGGGINVVSCVGSFVRGYNNIDRTPSRAPLGASDSALSPTLTPTHRAFSTALIKAAHGRSLLGSFPQAVRAQVQKLSLPTLKPTFSIVLLPLFLYQFSLKKPHYL
jgi:hypothetical protein